MRRGKARVVGGGEEGVGGEGKGEERILGSAMGI